MKRFKNIVYFADDKVESRPALERAAELALRNRARLTVLGALRHFPRDIQMLLPVTPPADLQDLALQDLRERLEKLVKPVRTKGLRLGIEVRCGMPFIEIIRDVIEHKRDLLMLTAEGSGWLRDHLLGSMTMRLMRKCPCPVWALKPGPHRSFRNILAAVDLDPMDEQKVALADKIMELATSLARLEGSTLRIVHAWDVYREDALRGWADKIARDIETSHRRWLVDLLARHDLTRLAINAQLLKGEPAHVIDRLAAKRGIDLIVMGTVGRTGIPGLLIGNTAETVLGRVRCSVLAVKPDGFVSPVKLDEAETITT
jgi:nucleotide-binding universal stress UspA family protein